MLYLSRDVGEPLLEFAYRVLREVHAVEVIARDTDLGNVLVVVEDPLSAIPRVVEVKLELDARYGDTGIMPVVVGRDEIPLIERFKAGVASPQPPEEALAEFVASVRSSVHPRKVDVVGHVVAICVEDPLSAIPRVVEVKLELDARYGDTGIMPVVLPCDELG